jgi:formylglycine-generating enzyme
LKTIFITIALFVFGNLYSQNEAFKDMALIPGGVYNMGKNTPYPTDWSPEHKVKIDSFYIDKFEVTNKQYYDFCLATNQALPEFWGKNDFKSSLEFPAYPVVGVNFFDAEKYAKWAGKRLPTEAEWEYAARGGLTDKNYPNGDQVDSLQVNYGNKKRGPKKTGSYPPNNYGLYDMAGNVWEWVTDNYGSDYYGKSPAENPKGPETGRFKVIRGGSFHSGGMCVQNYFRNGLSANWVDFAVGFRCVSNINK